MFGNLNIQKKLATVLWGSALTTFIVAAICLTVYQNISLERRAMLAMEPYAQMVSVGTDVAVAFRDPVRAREVLDTLRANPEIREAAIVLDDGRVLAGFGGMSSATLPPIFNKPDGISLSGETAELLQTLPHGARLRLVMGLGGLKAQMRQILWLFASGGLALLVVTLGQMAVLQRAIIRPVTALAAAAEHVRVQADYDQHVPAVGDDEIARLGASFNAMMETVRERDRDLRRLALFQRTILDNAAYGIISTTTSGVVTSFNPAAERLLGYTAEEIVGKQAPDLWHDPEELAECARRLSEELGETIPPGFEVFVARSHRLLPDENEWTFIRKDGSRVPVLLSVTALRDESGKITGFVGLANDLTERKLAEDAVRKLNVELEQRVRERTAELTSAKEQADAANRAKSAFLANMSHELRTPLNAVLGFSQLMRNAPDVTAAQKENLEIITRSGEHLLTLINNVLDLSKIESGRVELEESPLDLLQLMHEIASLMSARARGKGLDFTLEPSPDLPRHSSADGGKLRQVLINLTGNAIKFTKEGSVTLRAMVVSRKSAERARIRFEVEDTGPGIREEDKDRVFYPFVQVGDRPSTDAGSGLGLAICKQYVELMGGEIGIAGEAGEGALFHFEIPVTVLPSEAASDEPRRGRVTGIAGGQPRHSILIVEDQSENRLLLRKLLEQLGFDFREAVNGEEAVALFLEWRPHLIFMDIRMPVMDGLEATRRIKAAGEGAQTRIVALTAHALEEERAEILAAGCDDFIRKPYRDAEIFDILTKHLGVELVYEEETPAAPVAAPLDASALAGLPGELLKELEQALIRIDSGAVNRVIEEIRNQNTLLADALASAARELQFGRILRLIREIASKDET